MLAVSPTWRSREPPQDDPVARHFPEFVRKFSGDLGYDHDPGLHRGFGCNVPAT